jgi:hypothetical protein
MMGQGSVTQLLNSLSVSYILSEKVTKEISPKS